MDLIVKCLIIAVGQIMSVGVRTYSITQIVKKDKFKLFVSTSLAHLFRLITIAPSVDSAIKFSLDYDATELIVIATFVVSAGIGSLIGIKRA